MHPFKKALSVLLKPVFKGYYLKAYNVKYVYKNFEPNQKGPYFLIGNHVLLMDAFFSSFGIKGYAVPVTNVFAYFSPLRRFALHYLVDSIVKRKGQSDVQTIRDVIKSIKKGEKISLYPEGNASYYGTNSETIFATAKLLKKMKVDVVSVKTKGAYLHFPRWRTKKVKKGYIELEYQKLLTKEMLEKLSVEEINTILIEAYEFNDYEWNKDRVHIYQGKNRLEGSETIFYVCPECNSIDRLEASGDDIFCTNCTMKASIDDNGFLNGTVYDNFVDWGQYQEEVLKDNLDKRIVIAAKQYDVDFQAFKFKFVDSGNIEYNNGRLKFNGQKDSIDFDILKIRGAVFTEHDQISFDYGKKTFMFFTKSPKLLLDIIKKYKEAH